MPGKNSKEKISISSKKLCKYQTTMIGNENIVGSINIRSVKLLL